MYVLVSRTGHMSWTGTCELDRVIVKGYARPMTGTLSIVLVLFALLTGDRIVRSLNIPRE